MREDPDIVKLLKKEVKNKNQGNEIFKNQTDIDKFDKEEFIKELKIEMQNNSYYNDIKNNDLITSKNEISKSDNPHYPINFNRKLDEDLGLENKSKTNNSILNIESEDDSYINRIEKESSSIDDIDRVIIELVKVNRWLTPSDIAKLIGCSHTAINYRIHALYKAGLLKNYVLKLKKKQDNIVKY